jgi:transposase
VGRAPKPTPRVIGIDEIAIRKGHTYRIVVSDLERGPADLVWGCTDRSEASLDRFFAELRGKKSGRIQLTAPRAKAERREIPSKRVVVKVATARARAEMHYLLREGNGTFWFK